MFSVVLPSNTDESGIHEKFTSELEGFWAPCLSLLKARPEDSLLLYTAVTRQRICSPGLVVVPVPRPALGTADLMTLQAGPSSGAHPSNAELMSP